MVVPFVIARTHSLEKSLLDKMLQLYHLLCAVFTLPVYLKIKKVVLDNIAWAHTQPGFYLLSLLH